MGFSYRPPIPSRLGGSVRLKVAQWCWPRAMSARIIYVVSDELDIDLSEDEVPGIEIDPYDEGRSPLWKVGMVFLALASGVGFLLSGVGGDAFVYSRTVLEVTSDPAAFLGREIRVEGDLVPGSIVFREEPCEWRFAIQSEGAQLSVRFSHCVVPDTFRDGFGISVVALGELGEDQVFEASELVPRCPSKYEMQELLEAGEEMPHLAPNEVQGGMPAPELQAVPDASP